jgi:hypothetical protein
MAGAKADAVVAVAISARINFILIVARVPG